MGTPEDFTVGVEEEFFLVDAETGELRTDAHLTLDEAEAPPDGLIDHELKRSQVETGSAVCRDLDSLRASIAGLRDELARAAATHGAALLATGTHPFAHWETDGGVTPEPGYERLQATYAQLNDEQAVCGCHVHVGIGDPELAVAVMNRCRQWVPLLVALTANSPTWLGRDTGYASYRTEVFHRWPTAGIPEHFADRADYERVVTQLTAAEAIDEPARLYWDIRPSARYPTLEFRAADVVLTVDEAVAYGAIVRALVEVAHAEAVADAASVPHRTELLRAALWRAARFGLGARLLDVDTGRLVPAPDLVATLLARIGPVLEARGEGDEVRATVGRILAEGTGAERQRRLRALATDDADLVRRLVAASQA